MFNFITDAEIVKKAYLELDNYRIEYSDNNQASDYCAIYFSSHDIYFPNNDASFNNSIFLKDHYEWCHCRIQKALKHIFLRDVHKQWFLSGINAKINSAEKLLAFLKSETDGMKVITIGSSAGGYAAIRFGEQLHAEQVLAFSPRLNFGYLLEHEWDTNPIARNFKLSQIDLLKTLSFKNSNVYAFYPIKSKLDQIQIDELKKMSLYPVTEDKDIKLNIIPIATAHHGIPFPKAALQTVINSPMSKLDKHAGLPVSPFKFAADFIGWRKTIYGVYSQLYNGIRKILSRKLLK